MNGVLKQTLTFNSATEGTTNLCGWSQYKDKMVEGTLTHDKNDTYFEVIFQATLSGNFAE